MSFIRQWIETVIHISQDQAHYAEFHRRVQERIFLFAIEIGRKAKLTPKERVQYEKTLATVEVLFAINEKSASHPGPPFPIGQIVDECVGNWIENEPRLKASLEKLLGRSFQELEQAPRLSPAMRKLIYGELRAISVVCPDQLSEKEIDSILERLENPLDRA